jgi:hypothetical protein
MRNAGRKRTTDNVVRRDRENNCVGHDVKLFEFNSLGNNDTNELKFSKNEEIAQALQGGERRDGSGD